MYDRPIVILSSPRAGSTLLFEIMTSCKDIWSIGDESHKVIESISSLKIENNNFSNRLDENNANKGICDAIKQSFFSELRNRNNNKPVAPVKSLRFLEKTPKNSLRIPFLNKLFPDAIFIYLVRDPCENISSIMDAWQAGYWITYNKLPNWNIHWSLLLPPKWEDLKGKTLEEIAAFQWKSSNEYIINDLKEIPQNRWTTISYFELINNTTESIQRLCNFCDLEYDSTLDKVTSNTLPKSKYTLSTPSSNKWKKNENNISSIFPSLKNIIRNISLTLKKSRNSDITWLLNTPYKVVSRNADCPCRSGKKYKRCHGKQS